MLDWSAWKQKVRLTLFVSDLVNGDAVSGDCLEMQAMLRRWGFNPEIYVERVSDNLRSQVRPFAEYRPLEHEVIIFHYSTWSQMADYLRSRPLRNVLMKYHNITPSHFFRGANPQAEELTRKGREALPSFAPVTLLALGCSEYSRLELEEAGLRPSGVLPVAVDFSSLDSEPNREILRSYNDDWVNLLFVGRVAPQKRHEEIVKIFYYYRRINPKSRLFFVGAQDISYAYRSWLGAILDRLGIAADVHFSGHTPHADLLSYYRLADVFVCMSDHEGFCVPLVESMYLGIPIVAYASTAIPGTLADCGVLVHDRDYRAIAEAVHELVTNRPLQARLVAKGRERTQGFSRPVVEEQFAAFLAQALGSWGRAH